MAAFWAEGRLAGREERSVLADVTRGFALEAEIHGSISKRVEMILMSLTLCFLYCYFTIKKIYARVVWSWWFLDLTGTQCILVRRTEVGAEDKGIRANMSIADSLQAGGGLKEAQSHTGGNVGLVKKLNVRLNWIESVWFLRGRRRCGEKASEFCNA